MPSFLYNFSRKLKENSSKWKKATILRSFWKTGSGFGAEKKYVNRFLFGSSDHLHVFHTVHQKVRWGKLASVIRLFGLLQMLSLTVSDDKNCIRITLLSLQNTI